MAASYLHSSTSSSFSSFAKPKFSHPNPSYKPNNITMYQNKTSSPSTNIDVDSHIERVLSGNPPYSPSAPMHHNHLMVDAPRSMAPALCVAACEAVGGQREQALDTASALHLIHVSAFTHDDRSPTGYELLTRLGEQNRTIPSNMVEVIMEISGAMGTHGVGEGQYACAAACGAILGGASSEETVALRRFGYYIGMIHGMVLNGTGRKDLIEAFKCSSLHQLQELQVENVEAVHNFANRCFRVLGI